jgi:hypothetical protein
MKADQDKSLTKKPAGWGLYLVGHSLLLLVILLKITACNNDGVGYFKLSQV